MFIVVKDGWRNFLILGADSFEAVAAWTKRKKTVARTEERL